MKFARIVKVRVAEYLHNNFSPYGIHRLVIDLLATAEVPKFKMARTMLYRSYYRCGAFSPLFPLVQEDKLTTRSRQATAKPLRFKTTV